MPYEDDDDDRRAIVAAASSVVNDIQKFSRTWFMQKNRPSLNKAINNTYLNCDVT